MKGYDLPTSEDDEELGVESERSSCWLKCGTTVLNPASDFSADSLIEFKLESVVFVMARRSARIDPAAPRMRRTVLARALSSVIFLPDASVDPGTTTLITTNTRHKKATARAQRTNRIGPCGTVLPLILLTDSALMSAARFAKTANDGDASSDLTTLMAAAVAEMGATVAVTKAATATATRAVVRFRRRPEMRRVDNIVGVGVFVCFVVLVWWRFDVVICCLDVLAVALLAQAPKDIAVVVRCTSVFGSSLRSRSCYDGDESNRCCDAVRCQRNDCNKCTKRRLFVLSFVRAFVLSFVRLCVRADGSNRIKGEISQR